MDDDARVERYARAMADADDEDMYEWNREYGRRARAAVAVADAEAGKRAGAIPIPRLALEAALRHAAREGDGPTADALGAVLVAAEGDPVRVRVVDVLPTWEAYVAARDALEDTAARAANGSHMDRWEEARATLDALFRRLLDAQAASG